MLIVYLLASETILNLYRICPSSLVLSLLAQVFFGINFYQERRVFTTAVTFLMISADARASGLGEQGVATTPDAFSQHWNPSKYVFSENLSAVGVSYTPYLSKLVSDVFLANLNYYNVIDQRSSWSASFKYFSLGAVSYTHLTLPTKA